MLVFIKTSTTQGLRVGDEEIRPQQNFLKWLSVDCYNVCIIKGVQFIQCTNSLQHSAFEGTAH